eukprot:Em0001g448a
MQAMTTLRLKTKCLWIKRTRVQNLKSDYPKIIRPCMKNKEIIPLRMVLISMQEEDDSQQRQSTLPLSKEDIRTGTDDRPTSDAAVRPPVNRQNRRYGWLDRVRDRTRQEK